MKINDTEMKARFFAYHWGQKVNINGSIFDINSIGYDDWLDDAFLPQTPLSAITDEDAIAVHKILGILDEEAGFKTGYKEIKEAIIKEGLMGVFDYDFYPDSSVQIYQYLQSKGYALPFMGMSVEQLVSMGWIKLTES